MLEIAGGQLPVPTGGKKNSFGTGQVFLGLLYLLLAGFVRPLGNPLIVKPRNGHAAAGSDDACLKAQLLAQLIEEQVEHGGVRIAQHQYFLVAAEIALQAVAHDLAVADGGGVGITLVFDRQRRGRQRLVDGGHGGADGQSAADQQAIAQHLSEAGAVGAQRGFHRVVRQRGQQQGEHDEEQAKRHVEYLRAGVVAQQGQYGPVPQVEGIRQRAHPDHRLAGQQLPYWPLRRAQQDERCARHGEQRKHARKGA